jgi:GNAT superfamily N-acetyltransferase
MDAIIERPKTNERQEIRALFDVVIKHTFALENAVDEVELMDELIADQQDLIDLDFKIDGQDCFFLVARLNGKIVGTICHRPCSDVIIDCAGKQAALMVEIGSMYILPQYQGKGIAKQLLNAMYETLAQKGIDEFWLDSGYTVAKKVWAKVFGEPSIIMKDYWGEGIDHHLWYRKLDEVLLPPKER